MMFRRLHIQLTCLCALITVAILSLFTVLYLTVAEHTMRENLALSCRNHFDTLNGSMEQQSVLTYQYLLRMEQSNGCILFLWDNGTPLSFNSLEDHTLYQTRAEAIYENYLDQTREHPEQSVLFTECDPEHRSANLYAGICNISINGMSDSQKAAALRDNRGLVLLAFFPNADLYQRLLRQRILFALLSLAGCFLLTVFAYLFTGLFLKPLREDQEKQTAFIAGASHELRTPLAVILSAVSAKPPQYEEIIRSETLRMGHLVEELLLLSRLDKGSNGPRSARSSDHPSQFHYDTLEPDTFLLNFYEQLESYVHARKRHLSLHLPAEPVPQISADAEKVRQLLEIILQNAISYTETDGHICLSLSHDAAKKQICFLVSDDGIGIPDEEKSKIFDRFYRIENAHSDKEHFGLGLCIADEIIRAHKGHISVADAPNGGSVFQCYFPIKKDTK